MLATLARPLEWNAVDGAPVDTIAMILSPDGGQHLAVLGGLARSLLDDSVHQALRDGAPLEDFLRAVRGNASESP